MLKFLYRVFVLGLHFVSLAGRRFGYRGWYPRYCERNYFFYSDGTFASLAEEEAEAARLKEEYVRDAALLREEELALAWIPPMSFEYDDGDEPTLQDGDVLHGREVGADGDLFDPGWAADDQWRSDYLGEETL